MAENTTEEMAVQSPQSLADQQPMQALADQLTLADHMVYKKYLTELQNYGMVTLSEEMLEAQKPKEIIRLFQLHRLTLKKGEDMFQKLSTVYYSSMAQGCSLAVMIDVKRAGAPASIYLGVREDPTKRNMEEPILETASEALKNGLTSNFPGSRAESIANDPTETLLDGAFGEMQEAVASVSCVAALRDKSKTEDKAFVQGIERFMDAMRNEPYTALFLAEPVATNAQAAIRSEYENLYSSLSPFRKTTWSYTENQSKAVMESLCTGVSHTTSTTQSTTTTQTKSQSTSETEGMQNNVGVNVMLGGGVSREKGTSVARKSLKSVGLSSLLTLGGAAAGVAAAVLLPGVGTVASQVIPALLGRAGRMAGGIVGETAPVTTIVNNVSRSISGSVGLNASHGSSQSKTVQSGTSTSEAKGRSETLAEGTTRQESHGSTDTYGTGRTRQIELCNKSVEELLTRIDDQLKRTKESEDYGCYSCAAYFLSSNPDAAVLAANTYRALMVGEGSSVESGAVNVWRGPQEVACIREYLKRFMHPVFARRLWENSQESLFYTPATLVSGRELPIHLGLPTRSVHGLPVIEHAEFGRNVPERSILQEDQMDLGCIYHIGERQKRAELILNRQAMASHTFITGSTGTGKSNAVYSLLDEITKDGKTTFLVVEPAKGEYKHVFGAKEAKTRADVYGTNPLLTPLLRINPFAFPAQIHILEHIDRLVEIFNACWPMYAAMPAVLKDAIERSYQKVGWNLRNSESEKGVFPTFFDLLDILPGVIEESHYSKDTQSDYVGALYTRIKSLTNGIYGSVFCAEDALSDVELFDRNAIVDLSRVGSMETKALLMGILVMKLQEYRMCSSGMNSRLRHVTVLEEAHNLLRKTSAEQSQEGANLQGKSVEMLANAIAEMRTYGEGFIIADQAPGLLDMSVIRNTNTKIILRLPDEEDRKLVGTSAGLKEDQINELAKLELGVAAVYQNEWPEAVLCQVKHYPLPENAVYCKPAEQTPVNTEFVLSRLAAGQKLEPLGVSEMEQVKRWLKHRELVLGTNGCRTVEQALEGAPVEKNALEDVLEKLFDSRRVVTLYARADANGSKPRTETLDRLQDQYELKQQTAEWLLNHLMTMYIDHCQKPENAKELRRSFLNHGGKLL